MRYAPPYRSVHHITVVQNQPILPHENGPFANGRSSPCTKHDEPRLAPTSLTRLDVPSPIIKPDDAHRIPDTITVSVTPPHEPGTQSATSTPTLMRKEEMSEAHLHMQQFKTSPA